jgi:type IV fimbrial biogenesis protein FimT
MQQHHHFPTSLAHAAGSSLIELLCTFAVLSIAAGIAAPGLGQLAARQRLISATNSLVTGLHYARHTAIVNGRAATLCPSASTDHCGTQADWSHGWRVSDGSGADRAAATYTGTLPAQISVSLSQGRQQVRFLPDGRSPGTNLTLHLCSQGRMQRQIIISNAGRVRSTSINHLPCG